MGRSVMTASNAVAVVYFTDENDEQWEDVIDNVQGVIKKRFPSFHKCEHWEWQSDECRVILTNGLADVTISEYCGLAAVCLVPRELLTCGSSESTLCEPWCNQIAGNWSDLLNKAFGGLVKIGTGSNGEAFYKKIEK